jgi:hypothetical protein
LQQLPLEQIYLGGHEPDEVYKANNTGEAAAKPDEPRTSTVSSRGLKKPALNIGKVYWTGKGKAGKTESTKRKNADVGAAFADGDVVFADMD